MPWNPESIFVAMLALLAFASPAQAELINHTYWACIPNPPLLQVVELTDKGPIVSSNDLVHMPLRWNLEGPFHPEEEGRLVNISLDGSNELNWLPLWKICPRGASGVQNKDEKTKLPGGRNSNTNHGGSKDLQKAPPLKASTL